MKWSERFEELTYKQDPGDMATHIGLIYSLVRGINPRVCMELGVRTGESTLAILHGMNDALGREGWEDPMLYSVDMEPKMEELQAKVVDDFGDVRWLYAEARTEDFADDWFNHAQKHSALTGIDFLLIDADHSYEICANDWRCFAPFVRRGGYVFMHDTSSYPQGAGLVAEQSDWPKLDFPWSNGVVVLRKP